MLKSGQNSSEAEIEAMQQTIDKAKHRIDEIIDAQRSGTILKKTLDEAYAAYGKSLKKAHETHPDHEPFAHPFIKPITTVLKEADEAAAPLKIREPFMINDTLHNYKICIVIWLKRHKIALVIWALMMSTLIDEISQGDTSELPAMIAFFSIPWLLWFIFYRGEPFYSAKLHKMQHDIDKAEQRINQTIIQMSGSSSISEKTLEIAYKNHAKAGRRAHKAFPDLRYWWCFATPKEQAILEQQAALEKQQKDQQMKEWKIDTAIKAIERRQAGTSWMPSFSDYSPKQVPERDYSDSVPERPMTSGEIHAEEVAWRGSGRNFITDPVGKGW